MYLSDKQVVDPTQKTVTVTRITLMGTSEYKVTCDKTIEAFLTVNVLYPSNGSKAYPVQQLYNEYVAYCKAGTEFQPFALDEFKRTLKRWGFRFLYYRGILVMKFKKDTLTVQMFTTFIDKN